MNLTFSQHTVRTRFARRTLIAFQYLGSLAVIVF